MLHIAQDIEVVKFLVRHGANTNMLNSSGLTVPMKWVENSYSYEFRREALKILIDAGHDLKMKDS
jgi:ankyrin repeat protein